MMNIIETGVALLGFMLPLQLSQALFSRHEKRKESFAKRVLLAEAFYFLCAGVLTILIHGEILSSLNIVMYLLVYICSFVVIKICFDISNIEVVFITTCGYALQHMAYSVFAIIWHYIEPENSNRIIETAYNLVIQLVVFLAVYCLFIRRQEYTGERRERDPAMIALAVVMLACSVGLSVWCSNKAQNPDETVQILTDVICKIYAIVSCALIMGMEYAVSQMNMMSKQKEFMEQLIHTQGSQFQMSRESVSIINRKCHDIKYQMKALSEIHNSDKRQEYIDGLKKAISIYDSVYHTGNEALNLLLREKTLLCEEYSIQFSCMADGKALLFIETDDLYVLLGNALDNAIESVLKEEDIQKRVISMNIGERQGMKSIHIENYCKEAVEFQNGLPVTTKKDKDYHGFGVQSIQFIAEKYHGSVVMQYISDTFYLDVFFPSES